MPWMFTSGIMGDKKGMAPDKLICPWTSDCPSHTPFRNARKPKVKLVERIQPHVALYQCKWCGMKWVQDATNPEIGAGNPALTKNPALVGGELRI